MVTAVGKSLFLPPLILDCHCFFSSTWTGHLRRSLAVLH